MFQGIDDSELEKTIFSPVCTYCKHLRRYKRQSCAAFDHVPEEIWEGKNKHTKPYPGDHGIQFERVKETKAKVS